MTEKANTTEVQVGIPGLSDSGVKTLPISLSSSAGEHAFRRPPSIAEVPLKVLRSHLDDFEDTPDARGTWVEGVGGRTFMTHDQIVNEIELRVEPSIIPQASPVVRHTKRRRGKGTWNPIDGSSHMQDINREGYKRRR